MSQPLNTKWAVRHTDGDGSATWIERNGVVNALAEFEIAACRGLRPALFLVHTSPQGEVARYHWFRDRQSISAGFPLAAMDLVRALWVSPAGADALRRAEEGSAE